MWNKLAAIGLSAAMTLLSGVAMADLAGAPASGGGGAAASGGNGGTAGSGGNGGTAGNGDSKDGGGCAATPGGMTGSTVLAVGLGLLVLVPALRKQRSKKRK